MKTSRLIAAVALAIVLSATYFYTRRPSEARRPHAASPQAPANGVPSPQHLAAAAAPKVDSTPADQEDPSHLADTLNSPTTDIHSDLRAINAIFEAYRSGTHGEDPVGENAEITAVLTGRNSVNFAYIPKDSPAINAKGELCDRWGTPYFFHQVSGTEMEIRSAGPDKKLWTADDEVLTP